MASGNGYDAWLQRKMVNKVFSDDFKCTFCPPHRGENERRRDGKWRNGKFVPSKDKFRK